MANPIPVFRQLGFFLVALTLIGKLAGAQQWQKEAQLANAAPQKIGIKQIPQGQVAGMPLDFGVQLQNGKAQPASLQSDTLLDIQLFDGSGRLVQSGTCTIGAQRTDGSCRVNGTAAGVYKVQVSARNQKLLKGTGLVLVRPAPGNKQAPPAKRAAQWQFRETGHRFWGAPRYGETPGVRLLQVAYQTPVSAPQRSGDCMVSRGPAKVVLGISGDEESGGAFRAGDPATIQALFQADDGGSAPAEIRVWLSQDHVNIDKEPLVIPRCSFSGEARLTSNSPAQVTINYTVLPKTYAVAAPAQLKATFVTPIIGFGIVPKGVQRLSLIDQSPIAVEFFDRDGRTVPTDLNRTVKFLSDNSIVTIKDVSVSVAPGSYSADTILIPSWIGKANISVTADFLQSPEPHEVDVAGGAVIAVCMTGAILGGLVSFLTAGGKWQTRIVVGLAAGMILTWAYVFGILPKVSTVIVHNYFSVFVISILGGYLGIKVFDLVLSRLGWGTSQPGTSPS